MRWSVGMTRREIAQSVQMPDYGSPYLGDFAYTVGTCAHSGVVIANQAVGCQTVHDFNFGRKECGPLKMAALGFADCIAKNFSSRLDWESLKPKVEKFTAQWVILHCVFLRQYFRHLKITDHDLKATMRDVYTIPWVRRMRMYY